MASKNALRRDPGGRIVEIVGTTTSTGASNAGDFVALDATGKISSTMLPGGSGAPGGNNNEIQVNNAGDFGGAAGLTFDAASGLSVPGALILAGDITPAQITADQNDYAPAGLATAYVVRLSSDNDNRRINGIAGGVDGRILTLINIGAADIILPREVSSATAANRLYSDLFLAAGGGSGILQYDGTLQRWSVISATGDDSLPVSFRRMPWIFQDFYSSAAANNQPFGGTAVASGTSALLPGSVDGNHPGVIRILSAATATANSGYYWNTPSGLMKISGGEVFEAVLKPTNVTNCVMRWGFITSTTSADSTDGAYFEITTTGAVVGKTANNSTRTTTATIFTLISGTWYRFRIEVSRDFTSATFTVYSDQGAALGTQTATGNLPGAGRTHAAGIIATLTPATSSSPLVEIDYIGFGSSPSRPLLR